MPSQLVSAWPRLGERLEFPALGDFPTRVERLERLETELGVAAPLYVKRDDLTSLVYGGNKVRALEVFLGLARAEGAREIIAVGPYGSNQAVATCLHAPRYGLQAGAILFPQPPAADAVENLRVVIAHSATQVALPHWSSVPWAISRARGGGRFVMAPGGATPDGTLGYVAAGLELTSQIGRGELLAPRAIYLTVGSNATTAGLLVGLRHGARLGLGPATPPRVVAVRVTPWPVTSRARILRLAVRTSRRLAELAGDASLELAAAELSPHLWVEGRELGSGYGLPTRAGLDAIEVFARNAGVRLDPTYSAKAAAAFLRDARAGDEGPLLFWATKSSAPLPAIADDLKGSPRFLAWLRAAEQRLSRAGAPS